MIRNWLKLISRRYIDLSMEVGPGYRTRIVEAPSRWMAPAELEKLQGELRQIAQKTLSAKALDYGIFAKGRKDGKHDEALSRSIITIIYDKENGRPVAFNALAMLEVDMGNRRETGQETVLHLGLVMIDPKVQSRGLSWVLYGLTSIFLFLRNQMRPIWISSVTQVPAVIGMVSETFSDVFPAPGTDNRRSLSHRLLARRIMAGHRHVFGVGDDAGFDEEGFVITNAYTGGSDNLKKSFAKTAKHRKPIYNEFCKTMLDYKRGDDILQIGRFDLATARRFLRNQVPRSALIDLAGAALWIGFNRIALPVWYWSDATRPWQTLRAYKQDTDK